MRMPKVERPYPPALSDVELHNLEQTAREALRIGNPESNAARIAFGWLRLIGMIRASAQRLRREDAETFTLMLDACPGCAPTPSGETFETFEMKVRCRACGRNEHGEKEEEEKDGTDDRPN